MKTSIYLIHIVSVSLLVPVALGDFAF